MKKSDLVVGELYEIIGSHYYRHRDNERPAVRNSRCVEVVEVGVHREFLQNGWWTTSKRPDGVKVRPIQDGEDLGLELIVLPKDIIRPWAEKQAELDEQEAKKIKAAREVRRLRAKREILHQRACEFFDTTRVKDGGQYLGGESARVQAEVKEEGWKGEVTQRRVRLNFNDLDELEYLLSMAEDGAKWRTAIENGFRGEEWIG